NSRSTVGTMTELNDHLKLLYARLGTLYCRCCARPVSRDDPESISRDIALRTAKLGDPRLVITFPVAIPANFSEDEIRGFLDQQGYTRIHHEETREGQGSTEPQRILHVTQDRFRHGSADPQRALEELDAALKQGDGHIAVHVMSDDGDETGVWRYSSRLHCAQCDIEYSTPLPSTFSFNSPLGACEHCRGFGRVMGIDYDLVVPDDRKTLLEGAI